MKFNFEFLRDGTLSLCFFTFAPQGYKHGTLFGKEIGHYTFKCEQSN